MLLGVPYLPWRCTLSLGGCGHCYIRSEVILTLSGRNEMTTHTGNQMVCACNPCHPEKGDFVRYLFVSTAAPILAL